MWAEAPSSHDLAEKNTKKGRRCVCVFLPICVSISAFSRAGRRAEFPECRRCRSALSLSGRRLALSVPPSPLYCLLFSRVFVRLFFLLTSKIVFRGSYRYNGKKGEMNELGRKTSSVAYCSRFLVQTESAGVGQRARRSHRQSHACFALDCASSP